jgi:hypothetical protein
MQRAVLLSVWFVLSIPLPSSLALGQESKKPAKSSDIIVKGCLSGGLLESRETGKTYRLSGPKDTLRLLSKEHEGHLEEVTGELEGQDRMGGRKSRPVGKKTTVYVGASETRSSGSDEAIPELKIKSVEHVGACAK